VAIEESENALVCRGECAGQCWIWSIPDHDEQGDAMFHHRIQFIRFVPNSAVVGDSHPAPLTNLFQPNFVGTVVLKMVGMSFDVETSSAQNFRKALSEVAIGEKDAAHAARS